MTEREELLSGQTILESVSVKEHELVHVAVSFAGRLLADLGATVIRVIPDPDPLPRMKSATQEVVGDTSVLATFLNVGKRLLARDQVAAALSDVSPQIVLTGGRNPQLIQEGVPALYASAVGQSTDLDESLVSEVGIQGYVGLTDLFGEPDREPLAMGGHQTAYATGYAIFCAAMANISKRVHRGECDDVSVNAVDALAWVNWKGVAAAALGLPIVRGGKAADAPVLRCADGYFAFMHMPNNWQDIRAEVGDPRLDDERFANARGRAENAAALNDILAEWAAEHTWLSIYTFCQSHAIPGGPVLRGADLLEDPLYEYRGFFRSVPHQLDGDPREIRVPGLPLTIEGAADAGATERTQAGSVPKRRFSDNTPDDLPLSGKLVIDLGIFTAGSVTSTLLADLGATVIKVESEAYSDPFRKWPGVKGDSPLFTFNNRNKLGVNLDLKTAEGKADFMKLVAQADVVVENFRRGVVSRLGIDYPVLKAANPRIVLASISGQGASGPGSGHVSFGSTLEAIGGVAALTGYEDGSCYISGRNLNYPDQIVCLYGAGAVMAALLHVTASGKGLHIDVSQREVATLAVGEVVAAASLFGSGHGFPGNKNVNAYLQNIYAVADGWLCVTLPSEQEAMRLAERLGCELPELEAVLTQWLQKESGAAAGLLLRKLGVAALKANTGAEAAAETTIQAGTAFATSGSGKTVKGFPFQFAGSPLRIYEESPRMGEHTRKIVELLASDAALA